MIDNYLRAVPKGGRALTKTISPARQGGIRQEGEQSLYKVQPCLRLLQEDRRRCDATVALIIILMITRGGGVFRH